MTLLYFTFLYFMPDLTVDRFLMTDVMSQPASCLLHFLAKICLFDLFGTGMVLYLRKIYFYIVFHT